MVAEVDIDEDVRLTIIREVCYPPLAPTGYIQQLFEAAMLFQNSGKFQESLDTYAVAYDSWMNISNHKLDVEIETFFRMVQGAVLESAGQDSEALGLYQDALKYSEILPPRHPDRAAPLMAIGNVNFHLGDYSDARRFYTLAKSVREEILGPNHADTATTCNNLACVLEKEGNLPEALDLLEAAHSILELQLGLGHPRAAAVTRNRDLARKRRSTRKTILPKVTVTALSVIGGAPKKAAGKKKRKGKRKGKKGGKKKRKR